MKRLAARLILLLALALLLFGTADATPSLEVTQGTFDADCGVVRPKQVISYEILLWNGGDRDLTLSIDQRGCGRCPALSLTASALAPGRAAKLKVRYEAGRRKGKVVERAFLKTNDPAHPLTEVITRWEVVPIIEVRPEELEFGRKTWDSTCRRAISLVRDGIEGKVAVVKVESASRYVAAGTPADNAREHRIEIPVDVLPGAPAGEFATTVTITTNYQRCPRIDVPVRGSVLGAVVCKPAYFNFGVVRQGQETTRTVRVEMIGKTGGKGGVREVRCEKGVVACSMAKGTTGGVEILARLPAQRRPGPIDGMVVVLTDCPAQLRIELPVLGMVR